MPVPWNTPTSTAAANTIATTETMLDEWRVIASCCSLTCGKFTVNAIALATVNSTGIGSTSTTSMTNSPTVRTALNQNSFGRSVGRCGSRPSTNRSASSSDPAPPEPPLAPGASPVPPEAIRLRPEPAATSNGSEVRTNLPMRRRSLKPSCTAKASTTMQPTTRAGIIGTKTSDGEMPSAAAARAVGPPHGTMFIAPFARPATTVSTTGLTLSFRYSGSSADVTMMNVVDPSPSSDTTMARTAVPTTRRMGSLRTTRSITFTKGSNRPTSIMIPKKMIAKNNSAAVGATAFMPSATMSPMPIPAPAARPNAIGTAINPTTGVARFDMIKYMNTATIRKPSATSIATPCPRVRSGRDYGVVSTVPPLTVTLAYVMRVVFVVITNRLARQRPRIFCCAIAP